MTENSEENYGRVESFTDLDDAILWMESTLREKAAEGWTLCQSSGLNYVNHKWRVGLGFEREVKKVVPNLLADISDIDLDYLD